jgi:hypothetical protein
LKSVKGIEINDEIIKYFKNSYENLEVIHSEFLNFTLFVIESSNNHSVNRYLLDLIMSNIKKLIKTERGSIHKIISLIKLEGKLNFNTATKIVDHFNESIKEFPIFINSALSKTE